MLELFLLAAGAYLVLNGKAPAAAAPASKRTAKGPTADESAQRERAASEDDTDVDAPVEEAARQASALWHSLGYSGEVVPRNRWAVVNGLFQGDLPVSGQDARNWALLQGATGDTSGNV